MKKILKYYLPLTIFFLALGNFFLVYMFQNHEVVLRYFAGGIGMEGKGNFISNKVDALVKEDGVENRQTELFDYEGKLFMVSPKIIGSGVYVLIIDKERKDIFVPLHDCHELLFSKYLIEAECGQRGDYYGGEKHGRYQVKMELNNSQINFRLPEYNDGKVIRNEQIEIIFKGE